MDTYEGRLENAPTVSQPTTCQQRVSVIRRAAHSPSYGLIPIQTTKPTSLTEVKRSTFFRRNQAEFVKPTSLTGGPYHEGGGAVEKYRGINPRDLHPTNVPAFTPPELPSPGKLEMPGKIDTRRLFD
ncbi:hypothetical protein Bbelb_428690 [Branchiostoma belcheri]|nr:hypothetical protein Bbelb_428690 [Branchiostoma belcheri]